MSTILRHQLALGTLCPKASSGRRIDHLVGSILECSTVSVASGLPGGLGVLPGGPVFDLRSQQLQQEDVLFLSDDFLARHMLCI